MRDHTLEMSKFHYQASFVSKILRICTLSGWVLGNNLKAFPLFWQKKRQETLCGYYRLEVDSSFVLNG